MAPLLVLRASGSAAAKVVQEYDFPSISLGLLKEKQKLAVLAVPLSKRSNWSASATVSFICRFKVAQRISLHV